MIDTRGFRFRQLKSFRDPAFLPGAVKYGDLPALLALAALGLMLAHSAVDFPVQIPGIAVYFAALLGSVAMPALAQERITVDLASDTGAFHGGTSGADAGDGVRW